MYRRQAFAAAALTGLFAFTLSASSVQAQGQASARALEVTGQLDVIHIDQMDSGQAHFRFFLEDDATGDRYELKLPGDRLDGLFTGKRVKVRGRAVGREVEVDSLADAAAGGEGADASADAAAGARTALFLRVTMHYVDGGDQYLNPVMSASSAITKMYSGSKNINDQYATASHGALTFDGDADPGLDAVGVDAGVAHYDVIDVQIEDDGSSCTSTDYYRWVDDADDAANAAGVDLTLYQHRIYILPSSGNLACGWAGLGNVGCNRSDEYTSGFCRSWIVSATTGVITHEVGHNLGMAHAATDTDNNGSANSEYGDTSDPMGYAYNSWYLFNAPHVDQMNWDNTANSIQDVVASGSFSVHAIERDGTSPDGVRALRINRPDLNTYYYFSYRRTIGDYPDVRTTYRDQLNVHHYRGSGYNLTHYVDALAPGESFVDTVNGLTVTATGVQTDGSMGVDVSFGCAESAPTVSLDQTYVAVRSNESAVFQASVTNNDNAGCDPVSFLVTSTPGTLSEWTESLAPGATTSTPHLVSIPGSSLGEGSHPLAVTADDGPGHTTTSNATIVVDDTAPTVAVITSASVNKKGRATVQWDPASDGSGSGVDYYEVYREGQAMALGTTSGTSLQYQNGTSTDVVYVVAVDNVELTSESTHVAMSSGGNGNGGGGGGGGGKGGGGKGGGKPK